MGCQCSGHIDVCFHITDGCGIDTVSICHSSHRINTAGIGISCHGCDLVHLCFVELAIGDHCTNGGISCKQVLRTAKLPQFLAAVTECCSVFIHKACNLRSIYRIKNISQGIDHNDCCHLKFS